jgi:hypothetical protein
VFPYERQTHLLVISNKLLLIQSEVKSKTIYTDNGPPSVGSECVTFAIMACIKYSSASVTDSQEMAGPTACEALCKAVLTSFANQEGELLAAHPDAKEEISHIHTALVTIGQLIRTSPRVNGNGAVWEEPAEKADAERAVLCKYLDGKAMYTATLRLYALTHREMRESRQDIEEEPAQRNEQFREQKRRKRTPSDEKEQKKTKTTTAAPAPKDPRMRSQGELPTRNFFAP